MQEIDRDSIKRVTNGDLIVQGSPGDISKRKYEDGWRVVNNFRETEELEVERSGDLDNLPLSIHVKRKIPYIEFFGNGWYILGF